MSSLAALDCVGEYRLDNIMMINNNAEKVLAYQRHTQALVSNSPNLSF